MGLESIGLVLSSLVLAFCSLPALLYDRKEFTRGDKSCLSLKRREKWPIPAHLLEIFEEKRQQELKSALLKK